LVGTPNLTQNLFALEARFGFWITEYDGQTGAPLRVVVPPGVISPNHGFSQTDLAFGPNGKLFVSSIPASFNNFTHGVVEIDPDTGAVRQFAIIPSWSIDPYVADLTFGGPYNNLFVGTEFGYILEFDAFSGELLGLFAAHPDGVSALAWSPNGNLIVSGYPSIEYDGLTGAPLRQLPELPGWTRDLKVGPNGLLYGRGVFAGQWEIGELDPISGAFLRGIAPQAGELDQPRHMTFRPNGHLLVSAHVPDVPRLYPVFEYDVDGPVQYVGRFVENSITTSGIDGIALRPLVLSGDFDGDGDVDLSDFVTFQLCFAGSSNPPASTCPPGLNADLDGDGDVDLGDFLIFQQHFTGSQ